MFSLANQLTAHGIPLDAALMVSKLCICSECSLLIEADGQEGICRACEKKKTLRQMIRESIANSIWLLKTPQTGFMWCSHPTCSKVCRRKCYACFAKGCTDQALFCCTLPLAKGIWTCYFSVCEREDDAHIDAIVEAFAEYIKYSRTRFRVKAPMSEREASFLKTYEATLNELIASKKTDR